MSAPVPPHDVTTSLLSRRQVLAMSALASALLLVPRSVRAAHGGTEIAPGHGHADAPGARPMSVVFVAGARSVADMARRGAAIGAGGAWFGTRDAARFRPVPAHQFDRADATLAGGMLRVRIHGVSPMLVERGALPRVPGAGASPPIPGLELDVLVPARDALPAVGPLPFHAWTYRPAGPSSSPPLSFVLPAEPEHPPELRLTVLPADSGPVVYHTRFTLGDEPRRPRVHRGAYLLYADMAPEAAILLSFDAADAAAGR